MRYHSNHQHGYDALPLTTMLYFISVQQTIWQPID